MSSLVNELEKPTLWSMKRHKVKDGGTGLRRFPHRDLYERYGLYKVSTGAGWRSVHASA
jgi:hypothetical protein